MACELQPTIQNLFTSQTPPRTRSDGACYNCNEKGHYSKDCPKKVPRNTRSSTPGGGGGSSSFSDSGNLPLVRCPCDQGVCLIYTSKTDKNPGRKFFTCPAKSPGKCGFFKWCDQVPEAPTCTCRAGICSLNRESSGKNAGCWYFACRIKKNHGACQFFQWVDIQTSHKKVDGDKCRESPSKNFDDNNQDPDKQNTDLAMHDDLIQVIEHEPAAEQSADNLFQMLEHEVTVEDNVDIETRNDESLTRNSVAEEPAPDTNLVAEKSELNTLMMRKALSLNSQAGIHRRQREFLRNINAAASDVNSPLSKGTQSCSSLLKIYISDAEISSLHVYGWLGSLVFPPSQCLWDTSSPALSGGDTSSPALSGVTFPSFGPVSISEDVNMSCVDGPMHASNDASYDQTEIPPAQTYEQDDLLSSECVQKLEEMETVSCAVNTLSKSILKQYGDPLLNFLKSMEPCDHEEMRRLAEFTFGMLRKRSIDFEVFQENVMQYIRCASAVSKIEMFMHGHHSAEELIDQYSIEKVHFDEISHNHAKAMDSYKASNCRIQSLEEEVSRVKIMLKELEEQLSRCNTENAELKAHVDEISLEKSVSETKLETAYQEMEVALDLEHQVEISREAGNAALEKARSCFE